MKHFYSIVILISLKSFVFTQSNGLILASISWKSIFNYNNLSYSSIKKLQYNQLTATESGVYFRPLMSSEKEQNDTVILFFGEKLIAEKLSAGNINDFSWSLKNEKNLITGNGEELYNYILETPGNYTLDLTPINNQSHTHDDECNHKAIAKKININVLPYRIEFQFSNSKFSNQIKGETETEGTTFTIPISIFLHGINNINFDNIKLISSGVNTTIVGELSEKEKNYSSGKNNLIFNLKGKATSETYIMFDIFNGDKLINTYYYPNKITN